MTKVKKKPFEVIFQKCNLHFLNTHNLPDRVAQSVMCLATDASLIPAQSHTVMEIGYEIISTVILLPSAESVKKGCQLQAKVCAQSTG